MAPPWQRCDAVQLIHILVFTARQGALPLADPSTGIGRTLRGMAVGAVGLPGQTFRPCSLEEEFVFFQESGEATTPANSLQLGPRMRILFFQNSAPPGKDGCPLR